MKVRNMFNYQRQKGFVSNMPSLTVPDQTMSIRTLIERYARGLPMIGNNSQPVFDEDDPLPDLKRLDLSEIAELKEDNMRVIEEAEKQQKAHKKAKEKEAFKKQLREELEKEFVDKKNNSPDNQSGE